MAEFTIEIEGLRGDVIKFDIVDAQDEEDAIRQAQDKLTSLSGQFETRAGTSPRGERGSLLQRTTSTTQLALDEVREGARSFARNIGVNLLDVFGANNENIDARLQESRRVGTVEQQ